MHYQSHTDLLASLPACCQKPAHIENAWLLNQARVGQKAGTHLHGFLKLLLSVMSVCVSVHPQGY